MRPYLDENIFKKVNKEYGAYYLRKLNPRILLFAVILAILTGSTVALIPYFIFKFQKKEIYSTRQITIENLFTPDKPGGQPLPPPPDVPATAKAAVKLTVPVEKYLAPEVVDSVVPVEKTPEVSTDSINAKNEGKQTIHGAENGSGTGSGSGSGTGTGTGNGNGDGNGLYSKADVMPTFKGGDINKFREWVQKKTKYPQVATENGIQGKVYITFVVETDGAVSNVKVIRGVDPIIDNEALKSVMSSPKWSPGLNKGKAIRVAYMIAVNFEL
jgi:protein TonB